MILIHPFIFFTVDFYTKLLSILRFIYHSVALCCWWLVAQLITILDSFEWKTVIFHIKGGLAVWWHKIEWTVSKCSPPSCPHRVDFGLIEILDNRDPTPWGSFLKGQFITNLKCYLTMNVWKIHLWHNCFTCGMIWKSHMVVPKIPILLDVVIPVREVMGQMAQINCKL